MKISEIVNKLSAKVVFVSDYDREIDGGYAGDFLSFVMGKAPSNCAWFTVMNNVNVAAVALLAEVGLVVCCEGTKADNMLIERIKKENLNLIETDLDIYSAVLSYAKK